MIATRIVNSLAWLAKDGASVQVIVQDPIAEVRALATAVLAKVPLAWRPAGGGGGALICEMAFHNGLSARWHVHGLACPPGWVQTSGDDQRLAELAAAYVLLDLMRVELVRAKDVAVRLASEAN